MVYHLALLLHYTAVRESTCIIGNVMIELSSSSSFRVLTGRNRQYT